MKPRVTLSIVAAAAFAVTFLVGGWREGVWRRPTPPPAIAPAAAPAAPAPTPADHEARRPLTLALPAAPAAPPPGAVPTAAPTDADSPPLAESAATERQRGDSRGARTR